LLTGALSSLMLCLTSLCHAAEISRDKVLPATSAAMHPVMDKSQIPGVAVGMVLEDKTYVFNYGMASLEDRHPVRTYANPSIGALSLIGAKSMRQDFSGLMNHEIFKSLGLKNTYFSVLYEKLSCYAFGYTKEKVPIRVNPGMLSNEAYGVKATARDLTRLLKADIIPRMRHCRH
jgi:CubicO group peptidase (beta-lactamase class C family)